MRTCHRRHKRNIAVRLDTLLPRPLSPETGPESPSLANCLLAGIHLDRKRARSLGWRGILPSHQGHPAWTFRVAGSPHVYGLVFLKEHTDKTFLYGTFNAHVFPRAEDAVLDSFPLQALALAMKPEYESMLRNLSLHAPALAPFCMGTLRITAALDGSGLSVALSAPARYRRISTDGIAVRLDGTASRQWLVPPGGVEHDVPAFRLLLRMFTTLSATMASLFAEDPLLSLRMVPQCGNSVTNCGQKAWILSLHAELGTTPPPSSVSRQSTPPVFPAMTAGGKPLRRLPAQRHATTPAQNDTLPVLHILTGFLGAGKTTFLRRWLDYLNGREQFAAVIQNELGPIGLDAACTKGETHVEALNEGCVCCSLADSLRPGLQRLLKAAPAGQVILETTGVANPANVLESVKELSDLVRPGLVITIVDALAWEHTDSVVRAAQIEQADVTVVNKADAVSEARLEEVMAEVRCRNAKAVILPATHGNIAFAHLDALHSAWLDKQGGPPSHSPRLRPVKNLHHPDHTDEEFSSLCVILPQPVSMKDIQDMIRSAGPGLCRAKGIVNLNERGNVIPTVVQYAAGQLRFEEVPDDAAERSLVFIGTRLSSVCTPS